jgi:hypothetical protein
MLKRFFFLLDLVFLNSTLVKIFYSILHSQSQVFFYQLMSVQGFLTVAFSLLIQLSSVEHTRVLIFLHPFLSEDVNECSFFVECRLSVKDLIVVRTG